MRNRKLQFKMKRNKKTEIRKMLVLQHRQWTIYSSFLFGRVVVQCAICKMYCAFRLIPNNSVNCCAHSELKHVKHNTWFLRRTKEFRMVWKKQCSKIIMCSKRENIICESFISLTNLSGSGSGEWSSNGIVGIEQ